MFKDKYVTEQIKSDGGHCVYYPSNIFASRKLGNIISSSDIPQF